jgi:uncharacterized membrane protein YbhN (UPF0104 family)
MRAWLRKFWPLIKWVLTVAILIAIGRRFYHDLRDPKLWEQPLHFGWLAFSGLLYVLALCCFTLYWVRLLRRLGQQPTIPVALRAYLVGMMGKYLPGKAWALVMRAGLAGGPGVRLSVAGMSSFYEVLVTMSSGVLLAALTFAVFAAPATQPFDPHTVIQLLKMERPESVELHRGALVLLSGGLFLGIVFFVTPPVFNRIVYRVSLPFRDQDSAPMPEVTWAGLFEGLGYGCIGWCFMGVSLAAALQGVIHSAEPWDLVFLGRMMAIMGLGYVMGFVIIVVPSGLGVREFFLTLLLVPELRTRFGASPEDAAAQAVLTVLLLRLSWTVAELIAAAAVYWLPHAPPVQQTPETAPHSSPEAGS